MSIDLNLPADSRFAGGQPSFGSDLIRIKDAIQLLGDLIGIGGSGIDGALTNPVVTTPGIIECSSLTVTSPLSLPWFTIIRCTGDVTISSDITVAARPWVADSSDDVTFLAGLGPVLISEDTVTTGNTGGGRGGSGIRITDDFIGYGARDQDLLLGYNISKKVIADIDRTIPIIIPGHGDQGDDVGTGAANGGGILILLVDGNLNMTGGSITANGTVDASSNNGGGAGGYLAVHVNGTWTGGTVDINGADGGGGGGIDDDGGGGAGGTFILRVAAASGVITLNANGGDGGGDSGRGGSGSQGWLVHRDAGVPGAFSISQAKGTDQAAGDCIAGATRVVSASAGISGMTVPWL